MEEDVNEEALIIVCQGPPICMLEGKHAERAQDAGCQWCKRIYVSPSGQETVVEPGHA